MMLELEILLFLLTSIVLLLIVKSRYNERRFIQFIAVAFIGMATGAIFIIISHWSIQFIWTII